MKKIVKSFLMIAMTMAVIVGCGKKEQPEASGPEPLEVSVTVTEIADNKAVVTASIVSGEAASGKNRLGNQQAEKPQVCQAKTK